MTKPLVAHPCADFYAQSLSCLERSPNRADCKDFFDRYKECKKETLVKEREERVANRKGFFS